MTIWFVTSAIAIWVLASGVVLFSVCMLSSRLSQQEENRARGTAAERAFLPRGQRQPDDPHAGITAGDVVEFPAGVGNN